MVSYPTKSQRYNPPLDTSPTEVIKVSAHCIVRLKKKLHISNTRITVEESNSRLDDACTTYKKVRKTDKKLAKSYREELTTARAEAGSTTLATE